VTCPVGSHNQDGTGVFTITPAQSIFIVLPNDQFKSYNTSTMKKLFLLPILILLSLGLSAKVVKVCPGCEVKSIKKAIELAGACDTVLVEGGRYVEGNLVIDKELWLIGKNFPILDGEGNSQLITIVSNHVTVEGFQIQNTGNSYIEDRAAIRIKECRDFVIRNNKVLDAFFAIYLQRVSHGTVEGNEVIGDAKEEANSGNAIHLWYCNNIQILGNKVSGHRDGIYLEFTNESVIAFNHSQGNLRYGLHFMFSNDNVYQSNIFRKNGAGVAVMYSKRIDMHDNLFEQNWGAAAYGLLLKEINDSKITGNVFKENTVGVFTETSNRVSYTGNVFSRNGWAIKISGGCQQNQVEGNNFFSNSFDLAVHTAGVDNSFDGNFWSDYSGYDLDRDGWGDVPHRPMRLFSYVVSNTPESIVLLRSLFVDILNFSEKVSPIFTPENVVDNRPSMKEYSVKS
jgi:nitrous oxidase accessory protein